VDNFRRSISFFWPVLPDKRVCKYRMPLLVTKTDRADSMAR